jgi:hypothetical protein
MDAPSCSAKRRTRFSLTSTPGCGSAFDPALYAGPTSTAAQPAAARAFGQITIDYLFNAIGLHAFANLDDNGCSSTNGSSIRGARPPLPDLVVYEAPAEAILHHLRERQRRSRIRSRCRQMIVTAQRGL